MRYLAFFLVLLASLLSSAEALPNSSATTTSVVRKLVFPSKFSLGRLYVYKDPQSAHHYPNSKRVAESLGRFVGEAKGTVQFSLPQGAVVYLIASYQLTEQPHVLTKLDPNIVDCLSFSGTGIMAEMKQVVEPVSHLTGLRYLDFSMSELDDKSLSSLKSLSNLERLNLYMAGINGDCLRDLTGLKKLNTLELTSNLLDPKAYSQISKMQTLLVLHLNRCGVRDKDVEEVSKLNNVRLLGLSQNLITAKSLPYIGRMKGLQYLNLTDTKLSTRDLLALKGSKLKSINLPALKYSPEDMALLQRAMPHTRLASQGTTVGDYEKTLYGPLH